MAEHVAEHHNRIVSDRLSPKDRSISVFTEGGNRFDKESDEGSGEVKQGSRRRSAEMVREGNGNIGNRGGNSGANGGGAEEAQPEQLAQESEWVTYEATAYIALCKSGCTGKTATGVDVRNTIRHKGYRVIAVDPSVIPLGTIVEVKAQGNVFKAIAADTGGDIKNKRIDVLVGSEAEAFEFGRRSVKVRIIN